MTIRLRNIAAAALMGCALALSAGAAEAVGPLLLKSFIDPQNPDDKTPTMALHGNALVAFIIANANDTAMTGVSFTDVLPDGLIVADNAGSTPLVFINDCPGGTPGTVTANAGATSISLSGATIKAATDADHPGSCLIAVLISSTSSGVKDNTFTANSDSGPNFGDPGSASITVNIPPSISKQFGSSSVKVAPNGTTSLTFTLNNSNAEALVGVQFGDQLPGLVVANPSNVSNNCGGTFTGAPGDAAVSLTNGTIPANGSCTISLTVTGSFPGQFTNQTSAVTATNGGTGNIASDDILVIAPPVLVKQFSAPTMPLSGTAAVILAAGNLNPGIALNGVALTDTLPDGLVVSGALPPVINCTAGSSIGTVTAVVGSASITTSGGVLGPAGNCGILVYIDATSGGTKSNTLTGTTTEGGPGAAVNASIRVLLPPTLSKSFASPFVPPSVPLNQSTTMTFTMTNPNPQDALTGVLFIDDLTQQPGNVLKIIVSTPDNGFSGDVCGGTLTAPPGAIAIAITGATIPANSSCTFSLSVTGIAAGTEANTTTQIYSDNGGAGPIASATLYVVAPPVITMAFAETKIVHNFATILTFTIVNPPENTIPLTGVSFLDILPPGLLLSEPSIVVGNCGGGPIFAPAYTLVIELSNATLPVGASCSFAVSVGGTSIGDFTNSVQVASANGGTGNTATATLEVVPQIIPTLQEWALILLSLLLALTAATVLARRARS